MKYKLSLFLPLIIFVILVGFLLKGLFSDPRQRDSAVVGKSFPEFQLPDLMNEEKVHSLQTLRGEKVLLNVWEYLVHYL
ncbi:hypothetical protein [Psychrosphaera algicola]|uniref:hypothetical protein n=1 Tax=Psychrosphaera algicola TaxID=3023714 RepID=UPI002FEE064B